MDKNSDRNCAENPGTNSALAELFRTNRVVGVVGNRNTGKTSLMLGELIKIKEGHKDMGVYAYGIEPELHGYLSSKGIDILHNMEDIMDLKIKGSVIYIDEIAEMVQTDTKNRSSDRFKRFINRIVHNNDWAAICTAETKYWNTFACSMINAAIVKEIELDHLTNGTWLKRMVLGLPRTSEYRIDMGKEEFYVLDSRKLTKRCVFGYDHMLDSKKLGTNPFIGCDAE